jgi:hypothetical protein
MNKILSKAKEISESLGMKLSATDNLSLGNTALGLTAYAIVVTILLVM